MRGIRVLHVDDDQQYREVTAEWLARVDDDFEVVTEGSVADALDRLSGERDAIDCIVSDYDMPGRDGLDFLDAVREMDSQLPFILFTGKGSEQVAGEAMARDATDYLQKKGGREQYELLANRVRNAVEKYRSRRRVDRQRREYQRLFDEAPVMFAVFRDEGGMPVVENCNERFAEKLGYDRAEITGTSIEAFFTEESFERAMQDDGYERALAGEFGTEERTLRTKDGDTLDVLVRGVPRTDASGDVTGVLVLYVDLTERTERERELEEARQFYRTVVEESRDAVRIVQDGRMTFVDDRFVEMTGYPAEELVGEPAEKVVAPEYEEVVRASHDARMRDEDLPEKYEVEIETREGDRRHVELSVATIEQDGEPASLSLFRDVTDRVERQRELRRQKERLDMVVSNVPLVVYALDSDGVFTLSDGQGLDKLGLEPGEAVGESVFEMYGDNEAVRADVERALAGERVSSTHEVQGAVFDTTLQPVFEDGEVEAVIGVAVDVTERKERQHELERERDRLATLFENLPSPVLYGVTTEEGHVVERVNPAFEETFGYSQAEIAGKRGVDLIVPEDQRDRAVERIDDAIETGRSRSEGERETPEGRRQFRIETAVRNPDAERPERYTIYTDITDQKRRERELRRYEAIVEALGDAVYAVDADRRLEFVNERYAEMKGLDPAELLGTPIERWADEDVVDRVQEMLPELERGDREVGTVEYEFQTADGETIPVENRFTLIEFPDGQRGRVGAIRDVSERVERERELERERDRLDEFVSVISHDLRNPLTTLDASLELMETDDENVERARRAVDRMDDLLEDLLALARQGERVGDPEPVDLAEAATDAWDVVRTGDVALSLDADATVMADGGRLQQLFENLFRNSVEHGSTASESPGEADAVPGVEEITVGTLVDDEGFYVADDGVGFPASDPEKLLESGYSTDSDGRGLGLAIVEGVASGHGWDVTVTESESGGARFEFTGVDHA